jgi:hypothetical protein
MAPNFLLPETVVRENGNSPELELGNSQAKVLNLTLGITRIVEQESIDVSVWGSADATDWGAKPLLSFPQKFYCGTYKMVLDLNEHADVKYLRVQWKMNRWGRGDAKPLFGFYVFAQDAGAFAEASLAARL